MGSFRKSLLLLAALSVLAVTSFADVLQIAEPLKKSDLRWKKITIPITFSNSLLRSNPAIRPDSDVQGAIRRSLDTWENAANIEFQVSWSDKASVSPVGVSGDGTSLVTIAQTPENLLIFGGDSSEIPARTRVFFNRRNEISEADIVFNSYQQFSTDGSVGTFDFEATLTHEIGHLLGLEHSQINGATMFEQQGKNGIFNLSNFAPRTLSDDDLSQIRAIYGAKDDSECCGAIEGKLTLSNNKIAKGFKIWAEDIDSGRVIEGVKTGLDGSFSLKGLPASEYKIFAQSPAGDIGGQDLGQIEVQKGKTVALTKKLTTSAKDFEVQFIGFVGQLSKIAVPVNGGKSYQIFVAGRNLNPEELKIGSTSPFISVTGGNFTKYDYGKDISVFSFEIKIQMDAPVGDYTIYLQKGDKIDFLPGSLTIEKFLNPWSHLAAD